MNIRKMTISDYQDVYNLWMSCTGMGLNNLDDSKDGIEKFINRNADTCLVAEEDSRIVGVIMAGNDGRRGYILYDVDQANDKLNLIRKKCGLIVTSQVPEEVLHKGYNYQLETAAETISTYFGDCETLYAADTYQFEDYRKYHANVFDLEHKIRQRDVQFSIDLHHAYELGKRVCS
jgi:hypothetical protein